MTDSPATSPHICRVYANRSALHSVLRPVQQKRLSRHPLASSGPIRIPAVSVQIKMITTSI